MRAPNSIAGRNRPRVRRILSAEWLGHLVLGVLTGAVVWAPGLAWTAQFKQAPGVEKAEAGAEAGDGMILGLIHENTLFFIALAVFCVFWFLFGGGRKAKVGRSGH